MIIIAQYVGFLLFLGEIEVIENFSETYNYLAFFLLSATQIFLKALKWM